jgi:oxygen-independent coproporphyrinogen-3 oxidase
VLTIEERTPFGAAVARGAMRAPDDDDAATKYEVARDVLAHAGYEHYEISNWARGDFRCRHNLNTWTQGDYLGLGIGAHSHRDGVRSWNTRSLTRYLADPANARDGEERLDDAQRAEEWVSLRVRLLDGIDLDEAARRLGRPLATGELVEMGLLKVEDARARLTTKGMLLENEVTARLLSP